MKKIIPILLVFVANLTFAQKRCDSQFFGSIPRQTEVSQRIKELDLGQIILIPVVVHVVYSSLDQNISDDQIRSQIEVLNEDFRRTNSDAVNTIPVFEELAVDPRINFFLTKKDEFDLETSGISRTNTTHGPFSNDDMKFSDLGGVDAWNPEEFLNIWVCDLAEGVFGYGTPPGSEKALDGVVIDFEYFGTLGTVKAPFDYGRTATHEIGHYFGLNHLWGATGGCSDDDGIEDTPLQAGPSSGCQLDKTSCGSLDMVQNFMDLSNDTCMNFFTAGQKDRMRDSILRNRPDLPSAFVTGDLNDPVDSPQLQVIGRNCLEIRFTEEIKAIHVVDLVGRTIPIVHSVKNDKTYNFDFSQSEMPIIFVVTYRDRIETIKVALCN